MTDTLEPSGLDGAPRKAAEARFAGALSRAGALDGLSIGFRAAKARRDGRLRVLSALDLWEVSLVTFPMLPGARFKPSK